MTERLTPMDASFLYLEEPNVHMHVGGLAVFDPSGSPRGVLTLDRLRVLTSARLAMVPRFRQRVMFPPLDAARPVWVDDPELDLDYHVRRIAVPLRAGHASSPRSPGRSTPSSSTGTGRCGRCTWWRGWRTDTRPCSRRPITPCSTGWAGWTRPRPSST